MTDGVRNYILESSNMERQEVIAFGNVEVNIIQPLPESVSLAKVLHMISGLLPKDYYRGISKIQVSDHPKFANKEYARGSFGLYSILIKQFLSYSEISFSALISSSHIFL